jgi:predicted RNA-binding Zn ribbon-like protein
MTGQVDFSGYSDGGMSVSIDLANLSLARHDSSVMLDTLAEIVSVDPPSVAALAQRHVGSFLALAIELYRITTDVVAGDVDAAADRVNALLDASPAYPHLAKDVQGVWRLHHHPVDTELVAMWTAICAEATARLIGTGHADRLGLCAADDCLRAFLDQSKNASRRFCTTTCQNRTKAAAFRSRQAARSGCSPTAHSTIKASAG